MPIKPRSRPHAQLVLSAPRRVMRAATHAVCCAALVTLLGACAQLPPTAPTLAGQATFNVAARLDQLLPADILLVGERHDAAEHQRLEQQVLASLAQRGLLASVALEMADAGTSTASLPRDASDEQARAALQWRDDAWPWSAYGPAIMTAVRAGVPVLGANLPRSQMRASMANAALDAALPEPALKVQQQHIRTGHCNLLPNSQIAPMARIQIAKDISMASALSQAAVPGKVALLLAGSAHTDRLLGVPQHIAQSLRVRVIELHAGLYAANPVGGSGSTFDQLWLTPGLPEKDDCANLRVQFGGSASPGANVKP